MSIVAAIRRYAASPEESRSVLDPHYAHLAENQGDLTSLGAMADHAEEIESPLAGLYRAMYDQAQQPENRDRFGLPHGYDGQLDSAYGGHVSHWIKSPDGRSIVSVQHTFQPTKMGNVVIRLTASPLQEKSPLNKGHYAVVKPDEAEKYIAALSFPGATWHWATGPGDWRRQPASHPITSMRNAIEAATGVPHGQGDLPPTRLARAIKYAQEYTPDDFHRSIAAQPKDATNALMYADWLHDAGMPTHEKMVRAHVDRYENGATPRPFREYADMTDPDRPWHTAVTSQMSYLGGGQNWWETLHDVYLTKRVPGEAGQPDRFLRWRMNNLPATDAQNLIRGLVEEGGGSTAKGGGVQLDNNSDTILRHLDEFRRRGPYGTRPELGEVNENPGHFARAIRNARTEELAAHEKAVENRPNDPQGWLTLADHMQDNGEAGAEAIREHGNNIANGAGQVWGHQVFNKPRMGWMEYPNHFGNLWRAWFRNNYIESPVSHTPRFVIRTIKPSRHGSVQFPYHPVLLTVHAHHAGVVHVPVTPKNVDRIASDMGPDGETLRRAVDRTYAEEPERFAAYRAPAGGMIAPPVSNDLGLPGQFYPGGRFVSDQSVLPRKKSKVRKWVKAKVVPPIRLDDTTQYARIGRAVRRFSASQGDIDAMMKNLNAQDKLGAFSRGDADFTKRGVLADALQDNGRDQEAELLRSKHPVWVENGKITGGYGNHLSEGYSSYEAIPRSGEDGICHDCANELIENDPSLPVFDVDPYWEGPPLPCGNCGKDIESSYGDPEAEEEDGPIDFARAVKRYAADRATVDNLMGQMTPRDWRGGHGADYIKRGVLADAIQEQSGDEATANLLRDPNKHLYLDHGAIKDAGELSRALRREVAYRDIPRRIPEFQDPYFRQYLETSLWSSIGDEGEPLDRDYYIHNIHPDTLAAMIADAHTFRSMNDRNLVGDTPEDNAGHHFWLSRNGHGTGFWDHPEEYHDANALHQAAKRHGEYDLYVGDDGMIHGSYEVPPNNHGEAQRMARAVKKYAMKSELQSLFKEARENPYDETLHGAIADELDQQYPGHPVADLIRRQFGLGQYTEPRHNNWFEPVENSWDGTFPYTANLGEQGPFTIRLAHEGREGQNPAWVIHAVARMNRRPELDDFGYTFEFPHDQEGNEEIRSIPKMFPAAARYIHPGSHALVQKGANWVAGMPHDWRWRLQEAENFDDAMNDQETD